MKKIVLILSVLFSCMFSSYAYNQQSVTAYAGTPDQHVSMGVTINSYCTYLGFQCTWSANATGGTAVAFSDILLGQYGWSEGSGERDYLALGSGRYWSGLTVYLYAGGPIGASGTATIVWW